MVRFGLLVVLTMLASGCVNQASNVLKSPDGKLAVAFSMKEGSPRYQVQVEGKEVLRDSRLGLVREDGDFSRGMKLVSVTGPERVEDKYELLTAKRRINVYRGNRQVFHLEKAEGGGKMDVIFQVSNDGVGFRYVFPETASGVKRIKEEVSSFHFVPGTAAWLQPMSVAKSGWSQTHPSYEEFYQKGIAVGTPSTLGAGWVFPALFNSGEIWVAISEAGLGRAFCAGRLRHESPDGEYLVGFPDPRESMSATPTGAGSGGGVNPESTLPWATPWRVISLGSLRTVMESTLGTDLADKPKVAVGDWVKPGRSSWSWPLLGDSKTTYDVQKRFIDYAAEMGWEYCLIDALWDKQIGYERVKELADYAATKRVGILVWYNSAGAWNSTPQTPRDRMLTHASRVAEFARLKEMGVKGVKVDFFGGDGQSVINYYIDILEDTAAAGLLVNFHGATLPRGWQRTYPHLMTMEAIRGFEFVTFEQVNADQEASHAATIPFTRNLFDPMDFTPVCLDRVNDRVTRRTTSGFELALSVVFTSGIQHFAEIPEGMAKMPEYVRELMKGVPAAWEEMRFIGGYPGKLVVLARKSREGKWYVAGINGEAVEKKVIVDLGVLPAGISKGMLIVDGEGGNLFEKRGVNGRKWDVMLKGNGGFVAVME